VDFLTSFFLTHSGNHAGDVGGRASTLTDRVFGGLSDAEMRARPVTGVNSLVWLLWHMARTEDVAVNLVITAGTQVLDDAWMRRMRIAVRHIGSGMTDAEVADLGARADVGAVRAYRSAVGRRTREVVSTLPAQAWEEVIDAGDIDRAARTGAFRDYRPGRPRPYPWQGARRWQRLTGSAGGHNVLHHGEAITIRGLGGFGIEL
jgi:hypothetical protein